MKFTRLGLAALLLAGSAPALAVEESDPIYPHMHAMYRGVKGDPATAVKEADIVIAEFDRRYDAKETAYRCSSGDDGVALLFGAAAGLLPGIEGRSVALLEPEWCDAWFVKGFALIDLTRSDLAEPELRRAVEMSPWNAQFRNEYAELFKARREWAKSYALFKDALDTAEHSPDDLRNRDKARALRGMGFVTIELGGFDEAEALFTRSLEFEPGNRMAASELEYIARLKATRPQPGN